MATVRKERDLLQILSDQEASIRRMKATLARISTPPSLVSLTDTDIVSPAAGDILRYDGSDWVADDTLPRGVLGYAQITSNLTPITTETDLTGLTTTVTVGTSRRIKITSLGLLQVDTAAAPVELISSEGATQLQTVGVSNPKVTSYDTLGGVVILSPSSGSHTYKLRAKCAGGTATLIAGATYPAFILVEDIGAA
jgi:hypothetical protein